MHAQFLKSHMARLAPRNAPVVDKHSTSEQIGSFFDEAQRGAEPPTRATRSVFAAITYFVCENMVMTLKYLVALRIARRTSGACQRVAYTFSLGGKLGRG